jgi:hypothetical protein
MKHTRDQLFADAAAARSWAEAARASGRTAQAEVCERLADIVSQAAERLATARALVEPDQDDEARVRLGGFFSGAEALDGPRDPTARCCPFTLEGVCKGCAWRLSDFMLGGLRYCCPTFLVSFGPSPGRWQP